MHDCSRHWSNSQRCADSHRMQVCFKLLGLLSGSVGLRGRLEPVGQGGDTVKVNFEKPQVFHWVLITAAWHLPGDCARSRKS